MLSKSKGQVLRVSAAFHVLFCDSDIDLNDQEDVKVADVTTQIADTAIVAKILLKLAANMLHSLLEGVT